MKLFDLSQEFKHLPENQKNAILALIDFKTEQDMKEVIMEIRNIESKFDGVNDKIMTTRYIIAVGFILVGILMTGLKFLG